MKINKILTSAFALAMLPTTIIPAVSCNKSSEESKKEYSQRLFKFGNNEKYQPKKEAPARIPEPYSFKNVLVKWAKDVYADPFIFFDDVHYAIDREWYIQDDQKSQYSVLPNGEIEFTYLQIKEVEKDAQYSLSFEMKYAFEVEYKEQVFGRDFARYAFTGRIDMYDLPLIPTSTESEDFMFDKYQSETGELVPFVAYSMNGKNLKSKPWFIHGIELGEVRDWAGNKFDVATSGWLSGWKTTFDNHELGYFIEQVPFLYAYPSGGYCVNISNYYLKNNLPN